MRVPHGSNDLPDWVGWVHLAAAIVVSFACRQLARQSQWFEFCVLTTLWAAFSALVLRSMAPGRARNYARFGSIFGLGFGPIRFAVDATGVGFFTEFAMVLVIVVLGQIASLLWTRRCDAALGRVPPSGGAPAPGNGS